MSRQVIFDAEPRHLLARPHVIVDVHGSGIVEAADADLHAVGQGFLALMDEVYRTGVPYEGREAALLWDRDGDGTPVEGFFDFVYQPLADARGAIEGILVFAVDVTAQVRARHRTEEVVARTAS